MAIRLKVQEGAAVNLTAAGGDAALFRLGDYVQIITGDLYGGPYEVTPSAHDPIILETANKTMESDVTVRKIPYYETVNLFDGKTAYIAEEI